MFQQYNIDIDNPSELKKYITKFQKRRKEILRNLGYEQITFAGSKTSVHLVMPLIEKIMLTDLTKIYEKYDTTDNSYYVYVHCHPDTKLNIQNNLKHLFLASRFNLSHVPIYVGKGIGNRFSELDRNDSHRKIRSALKKQKKDLIPIKIAENLTEGQALAIESKLIDILGLSSLSKDGLLVNLDEGIAYDIRRKLYPLGCEKILLQNKFILK